MLHKIAWITEEDVEVVGNALENGRDAHHGEACVFPSARPTVPEVPVHATNKGIFVGRCADVATAVIKLRQYAPPRRSPNETFRNRA